MSIKNVVLIGAGGNLGPYILSALQEASFDVTILARQSSKSDFSEAYRVVKISDDYPYEDLVDAFQEQDAVVCSMNAFVTEVQVRMIDAASTAGVQRFIPAEFGLDSLDEEAIRLLPPLIERVKVQKYLDSKANETFSWTAIATGLFLDYGLKNGLFNVDLEKRTFQVLESGETRFSTTTMPTIGTAVARTLSKFESTRNKFLFIQTLSTTQQEMLKALQDLTKQRWTVERTTEAEVLESSKEKLERGDPSGALGIIYALGVLHSFYEGRSDFANGLLGLDGKNLADEVGIIMRS